MGSNDSSSPWFVQNPERLEDDIESMLWWFPKFIHRRTENSIRWLGQVHIIGPLGGLYTEEMEVVCGPEYPDVAPRAFADRAVAKSKSKKPMHLYKDGSLCVFWPKDDTNRCWSPEDPLPTFVGWSCEWLHVLHFWKQIGWKKKNWLGDAAPHTRKQ